MIPFLVKFLHGLTLAVMQRKATLCSRIPLLERIGYRAAKVHLYHSSLRKTAPLDLLRRNLIPTITKLIEQLQKQPRTPYPVPYLRKLVVIREYYVVISLHIWGSTHLALLFNTRWLYASTLTVE